MHKKSIVYNSPQGEMSTKKVQAIGIVCLTSRVAEDCKSRSEHDENGKADAEKSRVRCWESTTIATGALPTCRGVSPCGWKRTKKKLPEAIGVYDCGVYNANLSPLFGCRRPGDLDESGPRSSKISRVYVAWASGLFGLL